MNIKLFNFLKTTNPSVLNLGTSLGILEAVKQGAKVINLSIGGYNGKEECGRIPTPEGCEVILGKKHMYEFQHKVVKYAYRKGIVMVGAVGNDGLKFGIVENPDFVFGFYPANFPEVISVSALNSNSQKAYFSNYGDVDISAPGTFIFSIVLNNGYGNNPQIQFGTSLAAPMVSALASLILSIQPDMHPKLVLDTMCHEKVVTKLPDTTEDQVGCGRLNIGKVFTQSETDPSKSFPRISIRSDHLKYCNSDIPPLCIFGDRDALRLDLAPAFPFVVNDSTGEAPYIWTIEKIESSNEFSRCDNTFFNLPHQIADGTHEVVGRFVLPSYLSGIDLDDKEKSRFSALSIGDLLLLNPLFEPCFIDFASSIYSLTIDIRVTDKNGRSDIKKFDFINSFPMGFN